MSEIKQINTGVAEIIAVKVPEYQLAMVLENELFLNKLSQEAHFRLILPPGNWAPLGLSDQLTEERCAELLPYSCNSSMLPYTLIFASLMQAHGIDGTWLILKRLS